MYLLKKNDSRNLGLALCVVGIPLGMYFDFIFKGNLKWTMIFMAVSVFLIADWKNIVLFRYPSFNILILWVCVYQFIMLFYGCFSDNMDTQLLFYHLLLLAFCLALSSVKKGIDLNKWPTYVFILSIPSVILGTFFCASGLLNQDDTAFSIRASMGEDYNLNFLTIQAGVLYLFYSIMCVERKTTLMKMAMLIMGLMGGYVMLFGNKRTPIFILILSFFFFLYSKRKLTLKLHPRVFASIFVSVGILCVSYYSIEFIQQNVDRFIESFYNGVAGLMGGNNADLSVELRIENRRWASNYISENFTAINYLVGGGYMVRWIDFPLFQSYLDMGIVGLLFFISLVVFYPLGMIRKRINNNVLIFVLMLTLYPMFGIFSTGHPYQYAKYLPCCLTAFVYLQYKNNVRNNSKGK